jgi:serine/threonine protein kinase
MLTTMRLERLPTLSLSSNRPHRPCQKLLDNYREILHSDRQHWTAHYRLMRRLGSGGQGVVYLSERRGADGFTLPVALKVFSPERYDSEHSYEESMSEIARVAAHIALIQHDNLLAVHNFVDRNRIRMLVMEWIEGYDLRKLLVPKTVNQIEQRVSKRRWQHINRFIVTAGPKQPRFQPGMAVAIVRDCLSALGALHRNRIVHGDIKPGNIMLKRTGHVKIIDTGSAFEIDAAPGKRGCTPSYAAPEVLEGKNITPLSDLASIGYVLIELLAGQAPFSGINNYRELLEAKRLLPQQLETILPEEITSNSILMNFCQRLIAWDPAQRFASAEAAELLDKGAADFHRQLVLSNNASEYSNEIRVWLEELHELEETGTSDFTI